VLPDQPEPLWSQTSNLVHAKARVCRETVSHCSERADHVIDDRSGLGGLDQPGQLVIGQNAALMANVFPNVEPRHPEHWVIPQAAIRASPAAKRPDACPVVLAGL
jgi:hypothetical protein